MWCDGCNEKVGAREKALNIMFVACGVGAFGSGNSRIIIAIGDDLGGDCGGVVEMAVEVMAVARSAAMAAAQIGTRNFGHA